MAFVVELNEAVARSAVGKWFKLDGSGAKRERKGTRFTTEIRAGLTLTTWICWNRPLWLTSSPSTLSFSLILEEPVNARLTTSVSRMKPINSV
ncbi:hypothetical protein M413DRAFT_25571 [Hebeloma cylindrosporum]|uniref:Uncharacterized protein n=1 Tax=Hebeloma cylindrosporum TaxID=76867 RepID=A0A0C3CK42_HEBCY|nr:hypothetical protein M413DRAFT_25571 [Hebeloma cylindrosporum h7]